MQRLKSYSQLFALALGFMLCACQTVERGNSRSGDDDGKEFVIELPNLPQGARPLVMTRIPAGRFMMGSPDDEPGHEENESPRHEVVISRPFYMAKYEITQAQWLTLMDDNVAHEEMRGLDKPVNRPSWEQCQEFIRRLNGILNDLRYRLPTEAEWEYACRAGTDAPAYWGDARGDEIMDQYAWYRFNADFEIHPAGEKKPNAWGLYDMMGNVWEWCLDWYGPYPSDMQTDPAGPANGDERVIRGGSWAGRGEWLRSADRGKMPPDKGFHTGGFRIVRSEERTGA